MSVLFGTQNVPRATQFKVAQSNPETRPEFGIFADRLQAFSLDISQRPPLWVGKIRIGAAGGPPHAATDLVQLRKPQPVRIINNQGIGIRHINAGFNNGSAHQHIDLARKHLSPDFFQLLFFHLTVRHGNARFGHGAGNPRGHLADTGHLIVQIKDLPAPPEFPPDCLVDNEFVVFQHIGLHRQAVARRLVQN